MSPEIENQKNIEYFRKVTYDALIAKGIKPPELNSKEEQDLYAQWVKGYNLLQNNEH